MSAAPQIRAGNRNADAGSRMHVLDWVEGLAGPFRDGLNSLIATTGAKVLPSAKWMPYSSTEIGRREARLMMDDGLLDEVRQGALRAWWLAGADPRGNEPAWDLAATAVWPDGREGLILVDATAHASELSAVGKEVPPRDAPRRRENHESIGDAIAEARAALGGAAAGINISRDRHYHLSSRIAFAWKLARLGTPVVLVSLGFIGDHGMAGHLTSETHWRHVFETHCRDVLPPALLDRELSCGAASFWPLVRARMGVRLSCDHD
jgi:hypothetical protein